MNLLDAEEKFAAHQRHTGWVDAEGWKFQHAARRGMWRHTVARLLVALAARLEPRKPATMDEAAPLGTQAAT